MLTRRLRAQGERGQVVVMFALLIPVLFAIGAIVLDIGNWYVHKRHLQTQVDAAVLAAGPQFVGCFHDPNAANLAINSRALAYAGDTLRLGKLGPGDPDSTTNKQLQEPDDVRVALNSSRYWQESDGLVPGGTGYGLDYSIATPGDPCSTKYLDAKATDHEAPLLWGLIPLSPSPKTHAKVKIFDLESARGMLPWAVPEIDPARVAVLFVNEFNGVVFDAQYLDPDPGYDNNPSDGLAFPFSAWTTQAVDQPVGFGGVNDRTSIVVLVSKNDATPSVSGALVDICTQDPGLVGCYAGSGQTSGVSFIHAYDGSSAGASLATPRARQVELFPVGCSAADLSAAYFTLDGDCNAGVQAVINFGVTGDPTQHPQCARVPGFTWSAGGIGGALGTWSGYSMSLPAGSGRQELSLSFTSGPRNATQCGNPSQQPNSGSMGVVAAPYVANIPSGPLQYLKLTATLASTGAPVPDANSVEKENYRYIITVGLPKPLSIDNYTDPPVLLRFGSTSGSQSQTFDCDSGVTQADEVRDGCKTFYTENFVDPDGPTGPLPYQWNNILCNGWNTSNLPPPTFGPGPSPYPSDCVMTQTGTVSAQRQGLHERFEMPCVANNWPDDAAEASVFFGPDGGGYGNDPRYVTLIITDDTAFTTPGNDPLPIKYFAGFYVTGWDYHPTQSPGCPDPDGAGPLKGNDDHPIYGATGSYTHSRDDGDVWGYFVDIVVFSASGDPSENECDFGGTPGACIARLVE
jgi:Putative Flp pilus-assembly TadE/G-like